MTATRLDTMPNQPKTPLRSFRSSTEIWVPALHVAMRRGETMTSVLNKALVEYYKKYREPGE